MLPLPIFVEWTKQRSGKFQKMSKRMVNRDCQRGTVRADTHCRVLGQENVAFALHDTAN